MGRHKMGLTDGQKRHMDRQVRQAGIASNIWQERALRGGNFDTLVRAVEDGRDIQIAKFAPTFDPEMGIYRFEVNHDESLKQKLSGVGDATAGTIGWATPVATDEHYPSMKTGAEIVEARIVSSPGENTPQDSPKIADGLGPKELIDFAKAFPHLALDKHMPLVAPAQFWADADGARCFLYLDRTGSRRYLFHAWLNPSERWADSWCVLVRA